MTSTISIQCYCCPECQGRHVQTLDWVSVNDSEFVGGDVGSDFWCPDCESHPGHVEEREVIITLCLTCAHHAWGTRVPLPGVWLRADRGIERCTLCDLYSTDLAAAQAAEAEAARRGSTGRVTIFVPGLVV